MANNVLHVQHLIASVMGRPEDGCLTGKLHSLLSFQYTKNKLRKIYLLHCYHFMEELCVGAHIYIYGLKYSIEGFCVCLCVMSQELYLK